MVYNIIAMKKVDFLQYYFDYKDKIFNYFLYRLNFDKSLAEDLTSDVFLRAYKKIDTFDKNKASFQTWLYKIAHNRLANHYRDTKKVESLEEMSIKSLGVSDERYLNKLCAELELKLIIEKIREMPYKYSQILLMRLVSDLSYGEIAEILKIEEGNARVLFSRALKKINEELN